MTYSKIKLVHQGAVACLTLNTPENLNAMGEEMLDELNDALEAIAASDARAFVLTGSGRGFCSGALLGSPSGKTPSAEERAAQVHHGMTVKFNPLIKKIHALEMPTITAVNGVAAGGGVGLALCTDLVIAIPETKFRLVFTPQLGLIPDLGAGWHYVRALGRSQAMAAAYFGTPITAVEAVEAGLVWKIEPADTLIDHAMEVAQQLATGPTKAYPAVRRSLDAAFNQSLPDQLDLEAEMQPKLIATDDYVEGVRAFLQKRRPEFKGG